MNDPVGRSSMLNRLIPILALTALCWAMFVVNNVILSRHLNQYGIIPRHISSLPGIMWSPFLHASFRHLTANSVPLFVLGAIICARSKVEFASATVAGIILGGTLTWLVGRNASHIGASGLVFCYFGYLTSLAFFERKITTVALSVLCIVGYGGMLKGVLPSSTPVSWEGHLAGLTAGIAVAWIRSKIKTDTERPSTTLASIAAPK